MPYSKSLSDATLSVAAKTNLGSLVAAVSGEKIGVQSIFVSSDTALTVSFISDGTTLWKAYVAATSGFRASAPDGQFLLETAAGKSLQVSTSAAGNVFVHVLYDVTV